MFRLSAGQPRDSDTLSPLLVVLQITGFPMACKGPFSSAKIISVLFLFFLDLGSKTIPFLALICREAKWFSGKRTGNKVWRPWARTQVCTHEVLDQSIQL